MILSRFRQLIQLSSVVLTNSYIGSLFTKAVNANPLKGVCVPFLNCYACPTAMFSCPIGTMQHFMAIQAVPFYLLAFIGLVGITIGRMACGWVCPFGFLQDLIYKIRSPKFEIPYMLTYVKYLVLIFLVLIIPYKTGELWFSKLCPAGTLTAGIPWVLWDPANLATGQLLLPEGPGVIFYVALLILLGFLIWFVVGKRPFCRVVCPMGAILSVFNRYSMIRLEVQPDCDGCNNCRANCPMDLSAYLDINSKECIRCLECTQCGHVKVVTPFSMAREARCSKK